MRIEGEDETGKKRLRDGGEEKGEEIETKRGLTEKMG